jgi:hypothetical protein
VQHLIYLNFTDNEISGSSTTRKTDPNVEDQMIEMLKHDFLLSALMIVEELNMNRITARLITVTYENRWI